MKSWKSISSLFVVIVLSAIFIINGQKKTDDKETDITKFPTLEYQNQWADKLSAKQQKRRKKYNNRYAPKISESSDLIYSTSDWYVDLPALPTAKSDLVVVGEVTQAEAQLSEDETNIYSEFTIQISEVLKNDSPSTLAAGNSVVVERLGGRVRLPSGKVVVSRIDKQDLPRIGKRYVLFLTKDKDGDFHILTGYELRDGKVFPLDNLRPSHPITAYTGTGEVSFLTDLNKVLANPSISQSP